MDDIEENRRARLRIWFEDRPVPKEKRAQVSQLLRAKARFGPGAARNLECFCEMPKNYLDWPVTKKDIECSMRELRLLKARILRDKAGSVEAFAKKVGIDVDDADKLVGVGASKKIDAGNAALFEGKFEKPNGWLSDASDIRLDREPAVIEVLETAKASTASLRDVPLCRLIITMGANGEVTIEEAHNEGFVPFSTKSRRAYAARFRGDGGSPRVCSGDVVIVEPVEPDAPAIPGDTIIVFLKNSKKFIKKLLYTREGEAYVSSVSSADQMVFQKIDILEIHRMAAFIPYGSVNIGSINACEANKTEGILKTAG